MSDVADTVDTPMPVAPGRRLAEARQAQNLEPADIARQLKLSVWQVEALEAGRYAQLPGEVFVRGFIRNYARLVRLDPNELLRAAAEALPAAVPRQEPSSSREIPFPVKSRPRRLVFAATAAVMVAVLVAYEFYWNDDPEPPVVAARPAAKTNAAPPAPVAVVQAVATSVPETAVASAKAEPAGEVPQGGTEAATPAVVPPAGPVDTERQPKLGERWLRLAFERESWVEIRDRNERVIFSRLNSPGTQQLVQGVPPFSIVVGNAQGVRLTYGDRQIDLAPHTKIDVARLILE